MRDDMVERVALAISGGNNSSDILEIHRHRARAAIEAMREPTAIMVESGLRCEHLDLASEWRAMIDAALDSA